MRSNSFLFHFSCNFLCTAYCLFLQISKIPPSTILQLWMNPFRHTDEEIRLPTVNRCLRKHTLRRRSIGMKLFSHISNCHVLRGQPTSNTQVKSNRSTASLLYFLTIHSCKAGITI